METGILGWSGPKIEPAFRGGTGLNGSSAPNGSLPIGNGSGFALATLTGTASQVIVTNSPGGITLSTPQNIDAGASPTFFSLSLTATANQLILDLNGTLTWTPTTARTITLPDVTGTVITTGNLSSITSLGTIASGVWHGTIIGNLYGGTGLDTSTAGNGTLLIGNGTGFTLASLSAGSGITITPGSGSISIAATGTSVGGTLFNWSNFA